MAQQTYRDIGMDTMERLYYERKEERERAYRARKKRQSLKRKYAG